MTTLSDQAIELPIEIVASGLGFIECPVVDGDAILLGDLHAGVIRRLEDGKQCILVETGGAPNGLAFGLDGDLYVANNGGAMRWSREGNRILSRGFEETGFDARVERVDLATGSITRLFDRIDGRPFQAIDDLVFDPRGGFWFTDLGRDGARSRTYGGIYWSSLDGQDVREVAYPIVNGANGIGLSPDGSTLYATEYGAGRVWAWDIEDAGQLRKNPGQVHGGRLLWQAPDAQLLDSLKVSPSGNIVIATQPAGVLSVLSPGGSYLGAVKMPDPHVTNLCFDPADPTTAYATLASTGRLARIAWDEQQLSRSSAAV